MDQRPQTPRSASAPRPGRAAAPAEGLGGRLRAAREQVGISLRELARRVGVSASLISQIETDKVQPSVGTLYAIVSELDASMDQIVFGPDLPERDEATEAEEPAGSGPGGLLVQRAGDRDAADLASGVRWERLTPVPLPGAEFLYVVYQPGAESNAAGTYQRHAGREWSIVLRGTLHVSVAFDEFVLGPGDSISYDSTVPHRLVNHGDEAVHALWFQLGDLPTGSSD